MLYRLRFLFECLTCQADGYGAGHRELQCSLAHASMLEAGTARVTSCIRSHEWCTLQQWSGSLQACHERCLRPSRCLSLGVSKLSLQGRHCMVQDTACNHNLQFHCQVGLATRSKQQKFNKKPFAEEDQFHSDDSWSPQRKSQSPEGSLQVSRGQVAAEAGAANTSRWLAIHSERFLHPTCGSKCAAP